MSQPLWRVMEAAFLDGRIPGFNYCDGYAAELRAVADQMPVVFDPWLQEHADVADWLLTEAQRAEAGD